MLQSSASLREGFGQLADFEKEIKQDFKNDGPFCVKRLANELGQTPEAKKSLL